MDKSIWNVFFFSCSTGTYIPSLSPAHPSNSPQVSAMSPALRTPGSVSVAHSPGIILSGDMYAEWIHNCMEFLFFNEKITLVHLKFLCSSLLCRIQQCLLPLIISLIQIHSERGAKSYDWATTRSVTRSERRKRTRKRPRTNGKVEELAPSGRNCLHG